MKKIKNLLTDMDPWVVERFYDIQIRDAALFGNVKTIEKLIIIKNVMVKLSTIKHNKRKKEKFKEKE